VFQERRSQSRIRPLCHLLPSILRTGAKICVEGLTKKLSGRNNIFSKSQILPSSDLKNSSLLKASDFV
jgi:hypothetical protein